MSITIKREFPLIIHVSDELLERIEQQAESMGMTEEEYVKHAVLVHILKNSPQKRHTE